MPAGTLAHPGSLDKDCGHQNRKTGEYHYHKDWKSCKNASTNKKQFEVESGTVMRVKDGDTVVIRPADGGEFYTCRLYGIDAPEKSQTYGDLATEVLKGLVLGKSVMITLTGDKTYGREVCIIHIGGVDINREMVVLGYAWAYKRYLQSPYASEYIGAENRARANRKGLWKDNNPLPPWEFRRHRLE